MAAGEIGSDVVVVGGGPAGCAAAILCALGGLAVTQIEGSPFPRDRPGESLHPGIEPLLGQLGLSGPFHEAGFPRHRGHWVQWAEELRFEGFGGDESGPWEGYQAWRATFDALMLERSRAVGVTLAQPCRALAPLLRGSRVAGVKTTRGDFKARFVIDASGGGHWLARRLGLAVERYSPRLIAYFGYVRGPCPARDEAPALVADAGGWTWTARVAPEKYQWTRLCWPKHSVPRDWLPPELRGLDRDGVRRGADVTWRLVTASAGPGYFLAGDAAGLLDPATSHGVMRGIMTGMMAAHLITRVVGGEAAEPQAAHAYRDWLRQWIEADVGRLRALYARLPGAACLSLVGRAS